MHSPYGPRSMWEPMEPSLLKDAVEDANDRMDELEEDTLYEEAIAGINECMTLDDIGYLDEF